MLKGYIDRFAPADNAHDLSFDGWLRVCANAYVLSRLQKSARSAAGADAAIERGKPAGAKTETGGA